VVEVLIHENGLYGSFWDPPPPPTNQRAMALSTKGQGFFEKFLEIDEKTLFQVPYFLDQVGANRYTPF
jgi:hypothetical protein